jgi:hypothetical protein
VVPEQVTQALTISHAKSADLAAVYAFHQRRAGDYLWPRSYGTIRSLVDNRHLFIVKEGAAIVGLGYLISENDDWEIGGSTSRTGCRR